jgi:very-short-patch-repair endonuclease
MEGKLRHPQRERGLADLATRQHGVVSHRQLLALGFAVRWIEVRLWEGRLQAVHQNVYAVGHSRLTSRSRWWAALLAYGPGTMLSHRTGAVLWGIQRPRRGPIDVTAICGRQGIERRKGIWVHRCKFGAEDVTTRDGFPVTTVARTLFDLAEVAPYETLKGAAEEADRLKLLRLRELERVCEHGNGRRALRPMRRLLVDLHAPDEGRSPLEIRFAVFVREHRLPVPIQNADVLGHEVDALWPEERLIAELDSWEHHAHRAAFERDRARDPKMLIAGYRTIRVTHYRLDREPEQLAAEIRDLLSTPPPG